MFAREGYPYLLGAAAAAALVFAIALRARSWSLWLLAFALTVGTLGTAWVFRAPVRGNESAA
ncbi:MAG: hypothetical protein V4617_22145 [Gemmatimonadota bacterium]